MSEYERLVAEEITETIDRAGFEELSRESFRIEVTDSFQRKLGECQTVRDSDTGSSTECYRIRIARRLFDDERDTDWRDTVRHEVAHAYIFSEYGQSVQPHGDEWKEAARRAGADPTARYEGEDLVDGDYVLACPAGCFEQGYLQRSKRIKYPWKYACPECEQRLVSYDADEVPTILEPGTCYVSTIPWKQPNNRQNTDTLQTARYLLGCPNGCASWSYQQRSKRIKKPWLYTCPECETTLVSCDGQNSPTEFDPGTCNVGSISWTEPKLIHACPNGCFSVGYLKSRDETRSPEQYRCGECDARTVSYPVDQPPDDPTPGTNYLS